MAKTVNIEITNCVAADAHVSNKDSVTFESKDATSYTVTGLQIILPASPASGITVPPHGQGTSTPYQVDDKFPYTIVGSNGCTASKRNPPGIIID